MITVVYSVRKRRAKILLSPAIYLAKVGSGWIRAEGTELSVEDEEGYAQRCQDEAGFAGDFIARLEWQVLVTSPQECLNSAAKQGVPVYIISPGKLSKCDRHSFTSGLSPVQQGDSVFYMKAKGLTAGDGDGWGGVKTVIRVEGGVISQEVALAHFGKEGLLEILGFGKYADDMEFISEEEYIRDYAHGT